MKKNLRKTFAALFAASLLLTGCGGNTGAETASTPAPAASEAPAAVSASAAPTAAAASAAPSPAAASEKPAAAATQKPADPNHTHTVVIDPAVEATCQETGLTEGSHCETCGEVLVEQELIPVQDHFYIMGVCVWCGVQDPDFVLDENQIASGGSFYVGGDPIVLPEIEA